MQKMLCVVALMLFIACNSYAEWQNICPRADVPYCKEVGKSAHNNYTNPPVLRGVKIGEIVGVAWRPKGSVISPQGADIRTTPRDAYYYIINDGWGQVLRQCREIDAK